MNEPKVDEYYAQTKSTDVIFPIRIVNITNSRLKDIHTYEMLNLYDRSKYKVTSFNFSNGSIRPIRVSDDLLTQLGFHATKSNVYQKNEFYIITPSNSNTGYHQFLDLNQYSDYLENNFSANPPEQNLYIKTVTDLFQVLKQRKLISSRIIFEKALCKIPLEAL